MTPETEIYTEDMRRKDAELRALRENCSALQGENDRLRAELETMESKNIGLQAVAREFQSIIDRKDDELAAAQAFAIDGEALGQIVRREWVKYCIETGRTDRFDRICSWNDMDEWSKEADRRIGISVARAALRALDGERS